MNGNQIPTSPSNILVPINKKHVAKALVAL
jgi:hypothetical protein